MSVRSGTARCNQSSTAAQRGSMVQLEYDIPSAGSIKIYKCWGKRDNYAGGDTYSSSSGNACNIYVNGTRYWKQCRWIGLAPSGSDFTDWSPFRDSNDGAESPLTVSGLHGNVTITVEVASIADGTYIPVGSSWTWTINVGDDSWQVSYNANGGTTTPNTQTKYYGTNLTIASAITRNNTTADGVTITFDANGGSVSPTSKKATNTTKYSFTGWKSSATSKVWAGGATDFNENNTTTLTAQWSSSTSSSITTPSASRSSGTSTRKVTFDATTNGGTCSTSSLNSTATVTYSSNGWYTATSGGTKRCNNGGSYSPSSAETLHSQWGSSTGTFSQVTLPSASKSSGTATRTVTINANGGSSTVTSRTSTATITYSQTGWWTAASGGTNRGVAGAKYTPSASEKIYAQFSSSTGTYSAVTLPTTSQCTRTYYTLLGFSTSNTATTATYSPGASYTPDTSRTLYAVWQLNAPTAASISISSTVRDKITVSVSYTGTGLSNYTVYYRANSTGTYSSKSLGTTASGTITNLQPNTPYQLYVTATNAAGSVNSSTTTTTTKAYIPKVNIPVVSNLEVEQATITVSATGDTNAGITNYTLYKAVAPNLNKNLYDMPLKVMSDNSLWARIFYHNCKEGTVLFTSLAEAKNTQTADKYSRMYLLEDNTYKINGKFEFMLCYPEYSSTLYNRWKQTNAPQNEYITRSSTGGQVTGYEAVHIDWTSNYWGGLERYQEDATAFNTTWLDGSVGHGNWFYAIGAAGTHGDGIPSYSSTFGSVELWIRVGDITGWSTTNLGTSTSTTWTSLTEQTDYIVWVSATNAGGTTTGPSLVFTTPIGQATVWVKVNGTWVKGKVWYKDSTGTWVKCKKFYTKTSNSWVENKTTT